MNNPIPITTLFLDIGNVLLSNGWEKTSRKKAADFFKFNFQEMEERHHLVFVVYEEGKISLDQYLERVVFFTERLFTQDQFRDFMFSETIPHTEMIDFIKKLKIKYQLKIAVVSNEARELNAYRINTFRLNEFVDFFISSCFVHIRKPDADIFRLALDIAQVSVDEVVFIDDMQMFVDVARDLGIQGIQHNNYLSTASALADFGLTLQTDLTSTFNFH